MNELLKKDELYNSVERAKKKKKNVFDELFIKLIQQNRFLSPGVEKGDWFARARKMTDSSACEPYCCDQIGMKKDYNGNNCATQNRWGAMFYLSPDMTGETGKLEIEVPENWNYSVGYFSVQEPLCLFNATKPSGIADSNILYGQITASEALYVFVRLIKTWFNAERSQNNPSTQKVTDYIARILHSCGDIDGILYNSKKSPNNWNIALKSEEKVRWDYSTLFIPDDNGKYYAFKSIFSEFYPLDVCVTKERMELCDQDYFPSQMQSILNHQFPKETDDIIVC